MVTQTRSRTSLLILLGQVLFVSLATVMADLPKALADTITGTGNTASFTEGQSFPGNVATFTDTNTSDTAAAFVASIDWGDGATTPGTISGGGGSFNVSGPLGIHHYDEGSFTVTTSIFRAPSPTASLILAGTANVAEQDILGGSGATFSISPNTLFTGTVATFTDSDLSRAPSAFVASIDWGDGATTPGTISGGGGFFNVSGPTVHIYLGPGIFLTDTTIMVQDPTDLDTDTIALSGRANVGQSAVPGPSSMFLLAVGLSLLLLVAKWGDRWLTC